MSEQLIAVPHRVEAFVGACLPACLEMALAFFGIARSQHRIASQIGYIDGAGTPARNITRLSAPGIQLSYHQNGTIEEIRQALTSGAVPIVFVRTGELPHWNEDTPHALVIVGITADILHVNDPVFEHAPIPISIGDFLLAWYEFDNQWALVVRSHPSE